MITSDIKYTDLLIRHFNGEASAEEQLQLTNWRNSSTENEAYYRHIESLWIGSTDQKLLDDTYQTEKNWQAVEKAIQKHKRYLSNIQWIAIAASVAVLIGIGFFLKSGKTQITEISIVSSNEVRKVVLPDSSVVWMNRNSQITYASDFTSHRTLSFSGEGYFEVEANPANPFEVITPKARITVVGTKFNVKAYSLDSLNSVEVFHGKVRFAPKTVQSKASTEVLLIAGEKAATAGTLISPRKEATSDPNIISWKTREMTFNNTNIAQVIEIIGRTYHVKINLLASNTSNCNLSGNFTIQSVDEFLEMLREVWGISYTKEGETITINQTNCQ